MRRQLLFWRIVKEEASRSLRRVLGLPPALVSGAILALRRGLEARRRRYMGSFFGPKRVALLVVAISAAAVALYVLLT